MSNYDERFEAGREKRARGMQARSAAIDRLKNLHQEDWDRILKEERTMRGLPSNSPEDRKRKKIEYFQNQIDKYSQRLKEELKDAGN